MVSIPREDNHQVALFGVSSVDGVTPVALRIDPVTGGVVIDADSLTGQLDDLYVNVTGDTMTGRLTINRTSSGTYPLIITNNNGDNRILFQIDNENDSRLALDRSADSNEVRLSLLSAGAVRGQWRLDSSNNMIFQRATGTAGSETFVNSFRVMNSSGNVNLTTISFGDNEDHTLTRSTSTRAGFSNDLQIGGSLRLGSSGSPSNTLDLDGSAKFRTTAVGDVNLDIQAISSQTGDFLQFKSSGGSVLSRVTVAGKADFADYAVGGSNGSTGTFTTTDGKTVTVTKGLITNIV